MDQYVNVPPGVGVASLSWWPVGEDLDEVRELAVGKGPWKGGSWCEQWQEYGPCSVN